MGVTTLPTATESALVVERIAIFEFFVPMVMVSPCFNWNGCENCDAEDDEMLP
jgi:hypothetical protein